jgi:hypothetical protein
MKLKPEAFLEVKFKTTAEEAEKGQCLVSNTVVHCLWMASILIAGCCLTEGG